MKALRLLLIVFLSLSTVQVFSCSGENAVELIGKNEDFGRISFIACILMALATIFIHAYFKIFKLRFGIPAFIVLLLIAHPYHWLGVYGGDCGTALYEWSLYSLIGMSTIFLYTVVRGGQKLTKRRAGNSGEKN